MSPAKVMKDPLLPVLVLTFLMLVLFAAGLVNRLEPTVRDPTVGSLDQRPAVLSCVNLGCNHSKQGDRPNA
jgi:hypothetical protein